MKVLFVHNNFPAQFTHLAARLAEDPDNLVMAIGAAAAQEVPGVILRRYTLGPQDLSRTHQFARRFDLECRRAEAVLYVAVELKEQGFSPDVIVVHSGWGESFPLRAAFPGAKIVVYCEFFYGWTGRDVNFDSEFSEQTIDGATGLHLKNAAQLLALTEADVGVSPTEWQRSTYPKEFQNKITVIHEGIDTDRVRPDPDASLQTPSGKILRAGDEVLTYVARDLEPLRGWHVVARSLPRIMRERPNVEVVIIGGDGVSYGLAPPPGVTWKEHYLKEIDGGIDPNRLHFFGRVPYEQFLSALGVSRAHLYFTYPFVLSWSFLEAMSAGCVIVAGDVPTTREVIDSSCGFLLPYHAQSEIIGRVTSILSSPADYLNVGVAARRKVLEQYDIQRHSLPRYMALLKDLCS